MLKLEEHDYSRYKYINTYTNLDYIQIMPASNYIGNWISLLESSYIDINYYFISLIAIKINVP